MHLFIIYIGGGHPQALVELHDIRILVAQTIEDTYDRLRQSWWGSPSSLHLDAWGIVTDADGYQIQLSTTPPANTQLKLYFVNLGGYDSQKFTELHQNIFVVAQDPQQAKLRAVQHISHWESPHRDYLYAVDDVHEVNTLLQTTAERHYVHLHPTKTSTPFEFTCGYTPIGKTE